LQILKKFVLNGGYLITTDWSLENCTQRAFPGILEWNGGYSGSFLADATSMYPDSPYCKNVPTQAFWKLDNKCQTVRVRRRDMVKPLVRSRYLLQDDPDQIGILACTFDYGKGKVLHVVGHFDNNSDLAFNNALPDPSAIGISMRQAIMANFIVEGLESHKRPAAADTTAESEK